MDNTQASVVFMELPPILRKKLILECVWFLAIRRWDNFYIFYSESVKRHPIFNQTVEGSRTYVVNITYVPSDTQATHRTSKSNVITECLRFYSFYLVTNQ